ncbi:MAG TPA: GNAT family N-acetyltransferase [Candidatus Ozemobacteraceae bacterium]|nr:GNAT family N-acetyltransferase [Candidatus Ozemobacteraceae bacterium]
MQPKPDVIRVPVERILPLRQKILRAGMPGLSARFDGDENPTTVHLGALIDGAIVGCVTFLDSTYEGSPAWQLRGMAVDASYQGGGIGRILLEEGKRILDAVGPRRPWWCNAREGAAGFYEKLGWKKVSDRFEIPTVGPHYRMLLSPV